MGKFKRLSYKDLSKEDIEDIKYELIDFYEEFMDVPFEEVCEDLTDEGIIEIYNQIFSTNKPEEIKILDEWKEEYSQGQE